VNYKFELLVPKNKKTLETMSFENCLEEEGDPDESLNQSFDQSFHSASRKRDDEGLVSDDNALE